MFVHVLVGQERVRGAERSHIAREGSSVTSHVLFPPLCIKRLTCDEFALSRLPHHQVPPFLLGLGEPRHGSAGRVRPACSVVGGDREAAPVNQESIQGSATETTPRPLPRVQEVEASAPEIADGDDATVWSGEGGVTLLLDDAVELQTIVIRSGGGASVEVYGLAEGEAADSPEGLPQLGGGQLRDGRTTLTLDRPMTAGGVLLWFPGFAEVAEVQVVGVH